MKTRLAVIAISLAIVAGASHAKKSKEPAWVPPTEGMDYGEYPANYEAIIKAWYADNLKDPFSVVYKRISVPRQEHMITDAKNHVAVYGYSVCADVNAKNSYGAYTGAERKWFLIRNGRIERAGSFGNIIYIGRQTNCDDGVPPGQQPQTAPTQSPGT